MDLAHLFALTWVETAGLGRLDFGCAPLAPVDFEEHATTLFGLVAGAGQKSAPRDANTADLEHMQILACLSVRKVRAPGEEAANLRLVLSRDDEDESRNRLWVGRLPVEDVVHIAGAGIRQYVEASTRAARFRKGPEATAPAGRNSETIRPDTRALDEEAI